MGFFSFKKKDKTTLPVSSGAGQSAGNRLYLQLSSSGWRSLFLDDKGENLQDPKEWLGYGLTEKGWKRLEVVLRDLITTHAGVMQKADSIYLLMDSSAIQFTDSKTPGLISASGATARLFGQKMLNLKDVTFGQAEFPARHEKSGSNEKAQPLYAFADAQLVRNLLALFDKEGVKVREIIPGPFIILRRAFEFPDKVYGSLQIRGIESTLVLVNPRMETLLVRHIPVGILTMAQAVAEKLHMQIDEILAIFAQRDVMAEVKPALSDIQEDAASLAQSPQAQALQPLVSMLLHELQVSLDFFTSQRVAGRPDRVEVFGAGQRVKGLVEWLSTHSQVPLTPGPEILLEMFSQQKRPMACNLLKGSAESLLTVGRIRFSFTPDRGFIPTKDFQKQIALSNKDAVAQQSSGSKQQNQGNRSRRRPRRDLGNRPGRGSFSSVGIRFSSLLSYFQTKKTGDGSLAPTEGDENAEVTNDQKFFALFFLLVVGLLYWGWSEYEIVAKRYQSVAASYLQERDLHEESHKKLSQKKQQTSASVDTSNITKILWTEKFLALAKLMNDNIWLTDVYLSKATREIDKVKVESTKMTIEGKVLPSTDGHIRKIADYLDGILKDKLGFMSDFRSVTFDGARVEESENDAVVSFTFEAWYDQNKRVGETEEEGQEKGRQPGLADMHKNISKHNMQLEKSIGKGAQ